jgi:hypothetical protein
LEAVHSDYFCDEAITVNEGATGSGSESGALVTLSTFRGRTQHANCVNQLCGTDKAIQILGLGSKAEIRRNTFIYTRAPVEALGGTHMILDNVIKGFEKDAACGAPFHCGDAVSNPDKYCENLEFSTSDITLKNNVMAYCKFGIDVEVGANVTAENNWIRDGYKSAFRVFPAGTLTGKRNVIRGTGWSTEGAGCRGGLVAMNNYNVNELTVDFSSSEPTVPPAPAGRTPTDPNLANRFCQGPNYSRSGANLQDIRNLGNVMNVLSPTCTDPANAAHQEIAEGNCFDNAVDKQGSVDTNPNYKLQDYPTECSCAWNPPYPIP